MTAVLIMAVFLVSGCVPSDAVPVPGTDIQTQIPSVGSDVPDSDKPETDPEPEPPQETTKPEEAETVPPEIPPAEEEDVLLSLIQKMTLREKIGQMFIIRPEVLDFPQSSETRDTALSDTMADTLREYPVGGIIFFAKNIVSPRQITEFTRSLQNASTIPLFLSADEEGGTVARLANHSAFDLPKYKSAAAVGAGNDPADALAMGSTIGAYLAEYGFNMDFAPVADVNTNPKNPVIGSRAFSSDAATAAEMAKAMADGLKQNRIIPVFKHFPGHGDTAEDSHSKLALSTKTKDEMAECEWLPYKNLTDEDCVMVGHIAVPNITGNRTPATMSDVIIQDILRHQLGFTGVVITDALAMGAVTNEYSSGDAAVGAIRAGCDILLEPQNFREAFEAVADAVEKGTLSEERIDESVYRILLLKEKYGLWEETSAGTVS